MLSVSDNGTGVNLDERERIFEPFFTTKEVGKGTGLGLAMAYGIVQQHGGIIDFSSEFGVGSTFRIYLPKSETMEAIELEPVVADAPGGSETVLVAEDDDEVRYILVEMLESKGYQVISARDGEEALEVFKMNQHEINLVIMDMMMPRLSGTEVFKRIRDLDSELPIIICTGYSPDSADSEFQDHQKLRLIYKPYSPDQLFIIVREALDS